SIRTGKIVIYPIIDDIDGAGNQLVNWMAEIQTQNVEKNDWNKSGKLDDFLPIYQGWKFDWLDVGELIRNADTILEYPMVDKDPIARWTFGRRAMRCKRSPNTRQSGARRPRRSCAPIASTRRISSISASRS